MISAVHRSRGAATDLSPILDFVALRRRRIVWNNLEREDLLRMRPLCRNTPRQRATVSTSARRRRGHRRGAADGASTRDGERLCNSRTRRILSPYPDSSLVGWRDLPARSRKRRSGAAAQLHPRQLGRVLPLLRRRTYPRSHRFAATWTSGGRTLHYSAAPDRMHRQASHCAERQAITERCLALARTSVVIVHDRPRHAPGGRGLRSGRGRDHRRRRRL